jgi:hypothetical protein
MFDGKRNPAGDPLSSGPGAERRPAGGQATGAGGESPYAAITPRRSNRRAAAAIVALAALFASGWFGRDLAYPSLAHAVRNSSAEADTQPAGGGVVGLVTKTQLHTRGWPWLTVQSARVEGCLEAGNLVQALNLDEVSAATEDGGSAAWISLCDVQPDAVYLAHGRFPAGQVLPPTEFVVSDAEPGVGLEFDVEQPPASSGGSFTGQALPARVNSGEDAALVMFWRVELPEETKAPGECWPAAAESSPVGWYCVQDDNGRPDPFVITVELRSSLGFVRTERLDLTGLAAEN